MQRVLVKLAPAHPCYYTPTSIAPLSPTRDRCQPVSVCTEWDLDRYVEVYQEEHRQKVLRAYPAREVLEVLTTQEQEVDTVLKIFPEYGYSLAFTDKPQLCHRRHNS